MKQGEATKWHNKAMQQGEVIRNDNKVT
jgi:hypothetical protein